jgi:hypothetical protein
MRSKLKLIPGGGMSTPKQTVVNRQNPSITAIESALLNNDLMSLSPAERLMYVKTKCDRLGLVFEDAPFGYIVLNGKLTLYAKKDCTDQLRVIHNVSVKVVSRELVDDVYVVNAIASKPDGREANDIGCVFIGNKKGDDKANAMMKANTKAMRRVTLGICGLGGLVDESEIHSIKGAKIVDENYVPLFQMTPEQRSVLGEAMRTNGYSKIDLMAFIAQYAGGKPNSESEYRETLLAMSQTKPKVRLISDNADQDLTREIQRLAMDEAVQAFNAATRDLDARRSQDIEAHKGCLTTASL